MSNEIHAVGLDIGTSKIRCVVGEPADDGKMNIVGIGEADSKGLRRGVVTSTEAVAEAIRKAVGEAERVSGLEVDSATVYLSGEHFRGENKSGVVAVAGPDKEITDDDIDRAIDSASAMPLQPGWEIVDRLPQELIIDGQDGITEPIGMSGSRLEARVHAVISPSAGRQNLVKAVKRAGLEVEQTILEPLAAAESTLTDDDREMAWCRDVAQNGLDGDTLSGGEHFAQPDALLSLLQAFHDWRAASGLNFDILCYSGLPWLHLQAGFAPILALLDALIPEPFHAHQPTRLIWRGSANQPLIPLSALGEERYAPYRHREVERRPFQIVVDAEQVWGIGIPGPGDLEYLEQHCTERGVHLGDASLRG